MSTWASVRLTLRPASELSDVALARALRLAGADDITIRRHVGVFPFGDHVELHHAPLYDHDVARDVAIARIVWLVGGDPRVRVPGTSDNGFPQMGVNVRISTRRTRPPVSSSA